MLRAALARGSRPLLQRLGMAARPRLSRATAAAAGLEARSARVLGRTRQLAPAALCRWQSSQAWRGPNQKKDESVLGKYSVDLTERATQGHLDPVIGRDEEIRRCIQVLSRRTKNNPVLIGEPGVGKTAIAEGLAQRIISGDVPDSIKHKKIISLDLAALVAGAQFRGEFENRLKEVIKEVTDAKGDIILFVDEMHMILGLGGAGDGSMDAGNILKPALARGDLHLCGATTINEYRRHIEKDAALARRFQSVLVREPSVTDTISILRGLKEKYEVHHGVQITDGAVVAAATQSDRYIADRFLPDKAIDLVDEAASRLRLQLESKPEVIDTLEHDVLTLKIEEQALSKEADRASRERRDKVKEQIKDKEAEIAKWTQQWTEEKTELEERNGLRTSLDQKRVELEQAKRAGDFNQAGRLMYGEIPELEAKIKEYELKQEAKREQELSGQPSSELISDAVTAGDIALVVSRATGIPVHNMLRSEKQKLLHMEDILRERVVGQDRAITAISDAVRLSRAGLANETRPIASFLFLGPTGVGKTELCKAISSFMFDTDAALIRIDMSEYMERHSISRLIGAPPGYVGYDEGGQLTEAVRRRPYSVVLLDEFEKAHKEVSNLLLQVLDDGVLTDSQGRTVDFTNTIIVMTSNLGAKHLADSGDTVGSDTEKLIFHLVRDHFSPEFVNRIDELIMFNRLSRGSMDGILDVRLKELAAKLAGDRRITLDIKDEARTWLCDVGFDPAFGARPLNRVLAQHVMNPLARCLLEGSVRDEDTVRISVQDDQVVVEPNHEL